MTWVQCDPAHEKRHGNIYSTVQYILLQNSIFRQDAVIYALEHIQREDRRVIY